jgi:hypothetical protein
MLHSAPAKFKAHAAPGIGVEPDPEMMEKETLNKVVVK